MTPTTPLQLSTFIGRERESHAVAELISKQRLLTLVGAGGCGKTRLTIHVVRQLDTALFPDGIWFVELAQLLSPGALEEHIANAIGARDALGPGVPDPVATFIADRRACLVLDNCEHLIDEAANAVHALLERCPSLHVVATSREPLALAGESVWRVPPMQVPEEDGRGDLKSILGCESVQLFVDRARAARPEFEPGEEDAQAIAELCRQLDGVPLAIELAAARLNALSVQQVLRRLNDRLELLASRQRVGEARHRTLIATIDWSYLLLSETERLLLCRLAVFINGTSTEAAEAVAVEAGVAPHAIVDTLGQLVDKSLLVADQNGPQVRFRMLETIRQYALAKLDERGDLDQARESHARYFVGLAKSLEGPIRRTTDASSIALAEMEHENFRAALGWSLEQPGRIRLAMEICGALAWFWWIRGYHAEAVRWFDRVLEGATADVMPSTEVLYGAAWIAHHLRDQPAARALLQRAMQQAERDGDVWSQSWILHVLGRTAYYDGDHEGAMSYGRGALEHANAAGDPWLVSYALHLMGIAAYLTADYEPAESYYSRSLEIRRELHYVEGEAILLQLMALVSLRRDRLAESMERCQLGLNLIVRSAGPWSLPMGYGSIAAVAQRLNMPVTSVRLGGAAQGALDRYKVPMIPLMAQALAEAMAAAERALGPSRFSAEFELGQRMTEAEIEAEVQLIQSRLERGAETGVAVANGVLTPAETRVLELLRTGKTTREIADELVVATSTVDRHLTHIYQKMGARNRAEALALAHDMDLGGG